MGVSSKIIVQKRRTLQREFTKYRKRRLCRIFLMCVSEADAEQEANLGKFASASVTHSEKRWYKIPF